MEHRWAKARFAKRILHLYTETFHRHNWSMGCKLRYSVTTPEIHWRESVTGPELRTAPSLLPGGQGSGVGSGSGAGLGWVIQCWLSQAPVRHSHGEGLRFAGHSGPLLVQGSCPLPSYLVTQLEGHDTGALEFSAPAWHP